MCVLLCLSTCACVCMCESVRVRDRDRWLSCPGSEEPKGGQGKAQTTYIFKAERIFQHAMSLYVCYPFLFFFSSSGQIRELNSLFCFRFLILQIFKNIVVWSHVGSPVKASAVCCVNMVVYHSSCKYEDTIFLPNVILRKILKQRWGRHFWLWVK